MNAVWLINLIIIKKETPTAGFKLARVCACRRLVGKLSHSAALAEIDF